MCDVGGHWHLERGKEEVDVEFFWSGFCVFLTVIAVELVVVFSILSKSYYC